MAGAVTTFLASKGFATLTATNALLKVTASGIYTVGGATADTERGGRRPRPARLQHRAGGGGRRRCPSTTGANVVVIVGPDLATRFNPASTHDHTLAR